MRIEQVSPVTVTDLWSSVESSISGASHFEVAAQQLSTALHNQFEESIVLARMFVTVDYENLPARNQQFVSELAKSAAGLDVSDDTPVLSLVGTHGRESDWNDRRSSKGHVGIPLISAAFVDAIPMISRLLKDMGLSLDWVVSHDSDMVQKTIGRTEGLFFVDNAATATDRQGRKIIAAQDFVSDYGVKSVFGVGGAYPDGSIVVMVAFCSDQFERTTAENFLTLVSLFKGKTASLIESGAIFTD